MDTTPEQQLNQAAFRDMCDLIKKTYPRGRFLAISGGKIIADAADFKGLNSRLHQLGNHSPEVLVVQAGIEYPDAVMIFGQGLQP